MAIAGYILAGGKNSRMNGEKKYDLKYQQETFLTHIVRALQDMQSMYLSVEAKAPYEDLGVSCITDIYRGIGPIGGIHAGLTVCKEEALFVISCDTPCITKDIVQTIVSRYNESKRPVVVKTGERIHPLIGVYTKEVFPIMEEMIADGNYRMMHLIRRCGFEVVELEEADWKKVMNINDPGAYEKLQNDTRDAE